MATTPDTDLIITRLGERIGRLREERGWSQTDFARSTGLNRAYLNEVEAGKRNPAIKNLIKISQGLGVELSYLFSEVDNPSS